MDDPADGEEMIVTADETAFEAEDDEETDFAEDEDISDGQEERDPEE